VKGELPPGREYRVLEAISATALADAPAAIAAALDSPIQARPLEALARGKRSAAISVCDITRPVPNRVILPPLLERLERAGIPREAIVILIATGLHRGATADEVVEILGPEIAAAYRWGNHNARELPEHRSLGATRGGTPVYIDERFVAADLHITVGFVEPHLMLGFSGGRKLIVPGLAARQTIEAIHSPKFMRDERACAGSIEGNPLHRELLEIAAMARHDFMVDVALTRERGIAGVFAGDPVEAHRRGVEFVSRAMRRRLDRPVDAVITTAAGYPLDLTFYQSLKGVTAAQHVVKPGGKILLVAACEVQRPDLFGAVVCQVPVADMLRYDKFTVGLPLLNGWNNVEDNNTGKTIGVTTALTTSKASWFSNYYTGPEKTGTNDGKRNFFDTVVLLTPSEKANFYVNFDYGTEKHIGGGSQDWIAVAGAARFQLTDRFALSPRLEYYYDKEGWATGQQQKLKEFTFTAEYKMVEGLLARAEYRRDWSDQAVFERGAGGVFKSQTTLLVGVVAFFGPTR
jgi:nickel-dependent lactate racemase